MIINSSTVLPLNEKDNKELKSLTDLGIRLAKKISFSCGVFIISYLLFIFFTKTTLYFIETTCIAVCSFFFVFFLILNSYYKIYLDLKSNSKLRIVVNQYEIISTKKGMFLKTKDPKMKLEIDEDLSPYINTNQPIIIEITKRSKTLLFISHNKNNLLD